MAKNQSKVQFWVTDFELSILKKAADAFGMSTSAHIRAHAIGPYSETFKDDVARNTQEGNNEPNQAS